MKRIIIKKAKELKLLIINPKIKLKIKPKEEEKQKKKEKETAKKEPEETKEKPATEKLRAGFRLWPVTSGFTVSENFFFSTFDALIINCRRTFSLALDLPEMVNKLFFYHGFQRECFHRVEIHSGELR